MLYSFVCEGNAIRYFDHDFEWADCAAARHEACEGAAAPLFTPPSVDAPLPRAAATWNAFYARQGATFYKAKRYLGAAFPSIALRCAECVDEGADARALLVELGCGSGAAVLPLLRAEDRLDAVAVDVSSNAVALLRAALESDRALSTRRLRTATLDVRCDALPVPDGSADFVLCVFTLSAVEPEAHGRVFAKALRALRPGGALLFRDFGLYDVKQLKCTRRLAPQHYLVEGTGVQCHFFSTEKVAALAAAAGLTAEELKYCTVRNANRKTKKSIDRVFVHAVLRKRGGAA